MFRSLSSKLLALTIGFVMLAELLIFIPSVAVYRGTWLSDHLASGRVADLLAGCKAHPRGQICAIIHTGTGGNLQHQTTRCMLAAMSGQPLKVSTGSKAIELGKKNRQVLPVAGRIRGRLINVCHGVQRSLG